MRTRKGTATQEGIYQVNQDALPDRMAVHGGFDVLWTEKALTRSLAQNAWRDFVGQCTGRIFLSPRERLTKLTRTHQSQRHTRFLEITHVP